MRLTFTVIACLLCLSCTRRLSLNKSQDYRETDSIGQFTDTSQLLIKERELNITRFGDQLSGNIHIPASMILATQGAAFFTDSLESTGIKVKTTVTRDSAGNWKIGIDAKAKPVSVTNVKDKQVKDHKGISADSEVKTTSQHQQVNKQVTKTSVPWQILTLLIIAIVLILKYVLKLF